MKFKRDCNTHKTRLILPLLLGAMLLSTQVFAADPAQSKPPKATPGFATVGDVIISWQDYALAYSSEAANKFYHAKPKEDELASFQRQVGDKLITNALLVQEAKRRKIKPDNVEVDQELQKYEQRFANDPNWPKARIRVLPTITQRLQDENIRKQLEELVRNVPEPSEKQVREFYDTHPEKFTSPPQPRVSIILIRVDPSASEEEWNAAMEEAQGLSKRLHAGEDFAALARDYSGDRTAEDGGDMGYLHAGMLPGLPELIISNLKPGETADPVKLLEGVAIFRLVDRIPATLSSFDASKQRASELLLDEQKNSTWNSLIEKLKKKAVIHVDESRFLPLATAPSAVAQPTKKDGAAPAKK